MTVYIDKLQANGDSLDEAIQDFKKKLEYVLLPMYAEEFDTKVIGGQTYMYINGEWTLSLDEVTITAEAIKNVRAFIVAPDGIRLHTTASPFDPDYINQTGNAKVKYYPGTEIFFLKHSPNAKGWAQIQTQDRKVGHIEHHHISIIPKNPKLDGFTKRFYYVQSGDAFEKLAVKFYKNYEVKTGDDYRTITQAFKLLNEESDHDHGIYLQEQNTNLGEDIVNFYKDSYDPWMHDARNLYQEIRLSKHKIVRLPTEGYIDLLQKIGNVSVRPAVFNTALDFGYGVIEVAKGVAGFIVGIIEGFLVAIWEALEGIVDLISQIVSVIKKIFSGEMLEDLKKLYEVLKDLNIDELLELTKGLFGSLATAIETLLTKWSELSTFEKARTIGKIVGAIIFEIVLAIFTGGSANLAKWAGRAGKVGKTMMKIAKLGDKVKDRVENVIPPKYKSKKNKGDYEDGDNKNLLRQLLLNQARATAEIMDNNGSTITELQATLNLAEKAYPKLGNVRWPTKHIRDNVYSIGMVASDEKLVDKHFTSGDDEEGYDSKKVYKSNKGEVIRNKLEPHEFEQAKQIIDFKGGKFEGQKIKNTPGIDGYLDDVPVSLKEYTGESPAGVLKHASKSESQIKNANIGDADIYINAKKLNSEKLIDFASKGPLKDIPNQGTVKNIYIQVSDGWLEISSKGISKL